MVEQKPLRASRLLPGARLGVAATGLAALLLSGQPAAADSCIDQVRALASQHGMKTNPPTAAPGGKGDVRTQDLARSDGVIAPPPVQDKSVITPTPDRHDPMPTVPDVAPQKQQDGPEAELSGLQAALIAARAQAERGDEKGCQEALARARTLAERAKGG
jgi:hypothetical protein